MKKLLTNEKGLTLVELLAVFVIGAIFILLLSQVMTGVQKQYTQQSAESESLFDVTYAAKVVTKDFRMAETVITDGESSGEVTFVKPDGTEISYHYHATGQILYKNGTPFVREVTDFTVSKQDDMYVVRISNANGKLVETELIQR
ncbi:PilW family protein [Oceanobacillus locisalsi]|uniref:PilW family protein n=1 Tax=Oceanobacillus locisalsi TaxID=546107 RepID=A0ABW3NG16_9BACI